MPKKVFIHPRHHHFLPFHWSCPNLFDAIRCNLMQCDAIWCSLMQIGVDVFTYHPKVDCRTMRSQGYKARSCSFLSVWSRLVILTSGITGDKGLSSHSKWKFSWRLIQTTDHTINGCVPHLWAVLTSRSSSIYVLHAIVFLANYIQFTVSREWFKRLLSVFFPLDLSEIDANLYLGPFLEVIRSEDTAGPITGVALSSINKFLCYGLIGSLSIVFAAY